MKKVLLLFIGLMFLSCCSTGYHRTMSNHMIKRGGGRFISTERMSPGDS